VSTETYVLGIESEEDFSPSEDKNNFGTMYLKNRMMEDFENELESDIDEIGEDCQEEEGGLFEVSEPELLSSSDDESDLEELSDFMTKLNSNSNNAGAAVNKGTTVRDFDNHFHIHVRDATPREREEECS
jgi:hypothetical protein